MKPISGLYSPYSIYNFSLQCAVSAITCVESENVNNNNVDLVLSCYIEIWTVCITRLSSRLNPAIEHVHLCIFEISDSRS